MSPRFAGEPKEARSHEAYADESAIKYKTCCEHVERLEMNGQAQASFTMRLLVWGSWFSLGGAVLVAVTALFCRWGVNAESLGAHDAGLAILFAFVGAIALIGSTYAVLVLAILAVLSLSFERPAALRFLVAGATSAVPIAVVTWLERT